MLWVSVGLLLIAVIMVAIRTAQGGWGSVNSRYVYRNASRTLTNLRSTAERGRVDPSSLRIVTTNGRVLDELSTVSLAAPSDDAARSLISAITACARSALDRRSIYNFTRAIMFSLFVGFLLPVWCLSYATEPLGGERESRSLVWLLTRPIPRWAIYVGKYIALLPWALSFTIGGFALMCLAAGSPGKELFPRYWPAIAGGTFAFTSLFHLFSAATRRPTVVGLVYCFFLETMLGDMPGLMKRVSVSFYVRCLIFDAAEGYGIQPDKPSVYLPVDATTAWIVLAFITSLALIVGAWVFSRAEYRDDGS